MKFIFTLIFFYGTHSMAKLSKEVTEFQASSLLFTREKIKSGPLKFELYLKAIDIAQIWGDTILEGDFQVEDKLQLDQAYLIKKNNRVVFYYIKYSDPAWDTSTCAYDSRDPKSISGCQAGRIVEAAFVSLGLSEFEFDERQRAHFEPEKQPATVLKFSNSMVKTKKIF